MLNSISAAMMYEYDFHRTWYPVPYYEPWQNIEIHAFVSGNLPKTTTTSFCLFQFPQTGLSVSISPALLHVNLDLYLKWITGTTMNCMCCRRL